MKTITRLVLSGVVAGVGAGCSDSTDNNTTVDIVGSWHATSAVVTSVSNPATTANLILLGATIQVVFTSSLNYTSTVNLPGQAAETSTGTYVVTATQLSLTDTSVGGGTITFNLAVSGGNLILTGGAPFTFDFGSGEVPATFNLTLVH